MNKNDQKLFNVATSLHRNYFENLQSKITINTKAKSLISNVLGDYIWDMNTIVVDNPDYQLKYYFDNDLTTYVAQILNDVNHGRNAIINAYLGYHANQADFDDVNAEYETDPENFAMSDVSMEYYSVYGASLCELDDEKSVLKLDNQSLIELNTILKELNFKSISIFSVNKN